jgi:hypothetical protein
MIQPCFGSIGLSASGHQRRFRRSNWPPAGSRQMPLASKRFPSFGAKLRTKSGDYLLKGGSIGSLAIGTVLLSSNHIDSWGWIVMAPVCVFIAVPVGRDVTPDQLTGLAFAVANAVRGCRSVKPIVDSWPRDQLRTEEALAWATPRACSRTFATIGR